MTILAAAALFLGFQQIQIVEVPQLQPFPNQTFSVWNALGGNPVTVEVSYKFSVSSARAYQHEVCDRECRGRVHFEHSKCNDSCDEACSSGPRHEIKLEGSFNFYSVDYKPERPANEIKAELTRFGVPELAAGAYFNLEGVGSEFFQSDKLLAEIRTGCFNKMNCSRQSKEVELNVIVVTRVMQFVRTVDGVATKGPVLNHEIGEIYWPTGRVLMDGPQINCKCTVVPLDGDGNPIKEALPEHGAVPVKGDPNTGVACSTTELEQSGMAFVCEDMNKGTFQCTSTPASMENFTLPAGTLLEPTNNTTQVMMTIEDCSYQGDGSLFGSFLLPYAQTRISCTEINKKEPDPKVKFRIRHNPDTQLVKIAQACAKERTRGPWTQGRVWIATDAAKYSEIEKVMLPAPGKRNYVEGMYQCATIGEYDFVRGKHKRCLEPEQIGWGAVSQEANSWLIKTLAQADIEGLASYVSKTPSGHEALFSNARNQPDAAPASQLANTLLNSSSKKAREAGFTFLFKGVPENKRGAFIERGGVNRAAFMLCAADKSDAEQAIKVAEAYNGKGFEFGLRNVNPALPDSIKKKAAELLKKAN